MTSAAERIAKLIKEYCPSDVVLAPESTGERWLLIEQSAHTEEYYFTFHAVPDEAAEYNVDNEDEWRPVLLVNIDTGDELEPVLQPPKWVPKRS